MSTARQRRRGTTAQHATFTGLLGEITIDTDKKVAVVHDGITPGGNPLASAASASPVETQTHAATSKTTPVDADELPLVDSAASNGLKKLTWANLKATLWTAWGALIAAGTGKTTPVDADTFALSDSAASNATKKLTWANLKATLNTYLSGLGSLSIVAGDIIYGSATGVLSRLAKGTDGFVLTLASGLPTWAAAASGVSMRNRLVNPAMQVSQENSNTAGTTTAYYPADQWFVNFVTSAGTITTQRIQSVTPKGAKDRLRVTITVADASLAAGEFLRITQNIEGQDVADFQYGSASAKQGLLRFLFKGPAGTYAIALRNSATNRAYVALFTISAGQANTDVIQTFTIPGDTTGTWLTDTGIGLTLDIVLACGSTFQGTTGWQAGNLFGTSGVSNGMATGAAVFEIGEVGFYLDVASAGVFPTWELPDIGPELARCQRYWGKSYDQATAPGTATDVGALQVYNPSGAATTVALYATFKVAMRVAPTVTAYSTNSGSSGQVYDTSATDRTASILGAGSNGALITNTGVGGAANYRTQWTANARM